GAGAGLEARAALFEAPALEAEVAAATSELEPWLAAVEREPVAPPAAVLARLARAPRNVFDRVGGWLGHHDPRRVARALSVHLRRLYAFEGVIAVAARDARVRVLRLGLPDGGHVLAAVARSRDARAVAEALGRAATVIDAPPPALELFLAATSARVESAV